MNFYKEQTANVSLDSYECSRIDMHRDLVSRNRQVHVLLANDEGKAFLNRGGNSLHKSLDEYSTRSFKGFTVHNEACYREIERVFLTQSSILTTPVSESRIRYIDDINIDNPDRIAKPILSSKISSDSTKILKKNKSSITYFDPRSGCITSDSSKSRITMPRSIPRRRSHWNCEE